MKIRCSTARKEEFEKLCEFHKLNPRTPPVDIAIRWNSTFYLLEFALEYRRPLNDLVKKDDQLENGTYLVTSAEWARLEKLKTELDVSAQSFRWC